MKNESAVPGKGRRPRQRATERAAPHVVSPEEERTVGVTVDSLAALYVLDSLRGFGPQKFRDLWEEHVNPADVLTDPGLAGAKGKRWDQFRKEIAKIPASVLEVCRTRATTQIETAYRLGARILTYDHPDYPRPLRDSTNPVAPLYLRAGGTKPGASLPGRSARILQRSSAVACVGSRGIRSPYDHLHAEFAKTAAKADFTVVSGFALGADTIGHRAAFVAGGATIAVMPCGLDRPFPPENRALWEELLRYDGALFISEFAFGTRAASLTLRKRNRLIVALARGVLVSQSAVDGGAMNAFRFAIEQKKPIATFASDNKADTTGNARISADNDQRLIDPKGLTFQLSANPREYQQWLQTLSSST